MPTSRNSNGIKDLNAKSVRIVHGFAVTGFVFKLFIARLRRQSLDAKLFRYPSVGLTLNHIIDAVTQNLTDDPPHGIIAHSLGCFATLQAIHRTSWTGPVVLLAPPMQTLPFTRIIPKFMRWPFAPLLDHRTWTTTAANEMSAPKLCRVMTIAGRMDMTVPRSCTHLRGVQNSRTLWHTHNSMLLSPTVVDLCAQWISE